MGRLTIAIDLFCQVGRVVEWLERRDCDRHGFGSKPTSAILLCSWEKHLTTPPLAWWSWKAVINLSQISMQLKNQKKIQPDISILASSEAGPVIACLVY